jgi:pyrroloquinoline quinone biosynthesis protein B
MQTQTAYCAIGFFVLFIFAIAPAPGAKAIVLGIAQDGGIPQIGCTQKICKTQKHFVSSLALVEQNSLVLVDATPDLREQYAELTRRFPQTVRPNLFDGILLTHAHMGHYTGLLYLGKESVSTKKVPVWCSAEMSEYLTKNAPWSLLVSNGNIELHTFESGKPIQIGSLKITPVVVPHRKEFTDTHGFLIQGSRNSLLYIPDIDSWEPVKTQITEWLSKSNWALLDGTFYSGNELPGRNMKLVPHPTIQDSIQFLNTIPGLKCQIFFTHLNHTNPLLDPDSAEAKSFLQTSYHVAHDWQEFEL